MRLTKDPRNDVERRNVTIPKLSSPHQITPCGSYRALNATPTQGNTSWIVPLPWAVLQSQRLCTVSALFKSVRVPEVKMCNINHRPCSAEVVLGSIPPREATTIAWLKHFGKTWRWILSLCLVLLVLVNLHWTFGCSLVFLKRPLSALKDPVGFWCYWLRLIYWNLKKSVQVFFFIN